MGRGTVERFIKQGAKVLIADVNPDGQSLAKELGDSAHYVKVDVSTKLSFDFLLHNYKFHNSFQQFFYLLFYRCDHRTMSRTLWMR